MHPYRLPWFPFLGHWSSPRLPGKNTAEEWAIGLFLALLEGVLAFFLLQWVATWPLPVLIH